jgi:hypothetical protein
VAFAIFVFFVVAISFIEGDIAGYFDRVRVERSLQR